MNWPFKKLCFPLFLLVATTVAAQRPDSSRHVFDAGWRFFEGGVQGGQQVSLDDSHWRIVDLPHDWSIEDIGSTQSPFDSNAVSQIGGGFTRGGTGWYRKHFSIPVADAGKKMHILFEGIYMNADVWINGVHLGNHPYGYTSFWYDLSPYLQPRGQNILAIEVKNEGQNSRWYSGSGISRHVWIQFLPPVHLLTWGTQVITQTLSASQAGLRINTALRNEGPENQTVRLVSQILDPAGKPVFSRERECRIGSGGIFRDTGLVSLEAPKPWSPDNPVLYTLRTEIFQQQNRLQRTETAFGIRRIHFDAETGFLLNGKPLKLKGACFHNDNGPLGACSYDRAEERRIELLKASGFNAIRCAHNPPPPALLDACDRLGMLVVDEAFDMWREGKTPYDYHLYFDAWWKKDLESMVWRDINHPSIILWSIGNEIPNRDKPEVAALARRLAEEVRALDSSRPITAAVNDVTENKDPFFSALDIAGYNYAFTQYAPDHQRKPDRVMMGTESFALEAFDYWQAVLDHPYVIGDFIWTGFDYIGEASIGWRGYEQEKNFFPWNLAYCGDIDICGWKRPQSFYRDALWSADQLSLFVRPPTPSFPLNPRIESWSKWNWEDVVADWNWPRYQNKPFSVIVYSSCEAVELFLNGKSLGIKPTGAGTRFRASWEVPWQPGELKAVGLRNKKPVKQAALFSSGTAAQLALSPDRAVIRADGQDLCYVTVTVEDKAHHLNPKSDPLIHFTVTGPAKLVAVGNADPQSLESDQLPHRKAWRGKCLVILRSTGATGEIVLQARAGGLPAASVSIRAATP